MSDKKSLNEGYNPPKTAQSGNEQRGFNPPKTVQPKPTEKPKK